ncbi:MAG: hypothetical protein MUP76_09060 [Acidimicrobiia bacterium]|nr:hypothetical protein [Acidimicrobiia bacterium]
MEYVLFALLLGVWAALVIPSIVRSRRENAVTSRSPAHGDEMQDASEHRDLVLARRRTALIVLGVAVIGTLAAAILTGSWPILAISLVVDVALAAYVAILLQIKQRKGGDPAPVYDEPGTRVRQG